MSCSATAVLSVDGAGADDGQVSTRRYAAGLEPVGADVEATPGRRRSRRSPPVRGRHRDRVGRLHPRPICPGLDLVAVMIDGVHFAEHLCVVALGIEIDGTKHPARGGRGRHQNATVVTDLLVIYATGAWTHPADAGRPRRRQGAVDGGADVFDHPVIQRASYKIRTSKAKLTERLGSNVAGKMRAAYHDADRAARRGGPGGVGPSSTRPTPAPPGSLREGLEETLTVLRLGVPPTLARTLRSTNAIESMIGICRDHAKTSNAGATGRWPCAGAPPAWSKPASSSPRQRPPPPPRPPRRTRSPGRPNCQCPHA